MARKEFTPKTKLAAWTRENGHCQDCGIKIRPGSGPEYDHEIEDYFDGGNQVENCRILCIPCHSQKTRARAAPIAKSRRIIKSAANAKTKRAGFRGWRKFNGDVVWRD